MLNRDAAAEANKETSSDEAAVVLKLIDSAIRVGREPHTETEGDSSLSRDQ